VTGYRLGDRGSISGRGKEEIFSLHYCVLMGSGAHQGLFSRQ